MCAISVKIRILLLAAALCVSAASTHAQLGDLRLPISLDADSTDYDGKSSMLMFQGLRLTQGSIGVEADEGRASKLDFEDSVWHFAGNVIIDTENAQLPVKLLRSTKRWKNLQSWLTLTRSMMVGCSKLRPAM